MTRRRLAEHPGELLALAARRDAAERQRILAHVVRRNRRRIDDVPRPDRERDEIGRQRLRRRERQCFPLAVGRFLLGDLPRVRDRDFVRRHGQLDVERRLEARLVEAGKRPARADRLHLRDAVRVVADLDLVEPFELAVERRRVVERELDVAGRQRAGRSALRGRRLRHARSLARPDALRRWPNSTVAFAMSMLLRMQEDAVCGRWQA